VLPHLAQDACLSRCHEQFSSAMWEEKGLGRPGSLPPRDTVNPYKSNFTISQVRQLRSLITMRNFIWLKDVHGQKRYASPFRHWDAILNCQTVELLTKLLLANSQWFLEEWLGKPINNNSVGLGII
jgi:hypothetical protein